MLTHRYKTFYFYVVSENPCTLATHVWQKVNISIMFLMYTFLTNLEKQQANEAAQ